MQIANLSYAYGSKSLFKDVNLSVESANFILIRGPSGCGKSTFLKLIAELLPLQKGSISYVKPEVKIGYLHQDCHLIEHWTVKENLHLVTSDSKLMQDFLKRFELLDRLNSLASQLSGGEKQRISIIRILLQNPDLVLLDEPTAHLDDLNAVAIIKFVKEYLKSKLVIMVSHDHRIDSLANQVIDWKSISHV